MENQLFCEYLNDVINRSAVKQIDIAKGLGFDHANNITMYKQGKTRVPLHRIPDLARILSLDPKALFKRAMLEYDPLLFRAIEKVFGGLITKNEQLILNEIRALSHGSDPAISSSSDRVAIEEFVAKLTNKHG